MKQAIYKGNKTIEVSAGQAQVPGPDEVRIDVAYCGICGTDLHIFLGHMDQRVDIPQVVGHEMSGIVAEVGSNVTAWQAGDPVVVRPLDPCNDCPSCAAGHRHICQNLRFLGIETPGAFQSSWTVPAHTLHRLPNDIALDHAAMIEPIAVACHDVRMGRIAQGEKVVVIGGGPIGILNALVARHAGGDVTVSEVNPYRIHLAEELGLNTVNPLETDLSAYVADWTGGAGADVVFEVSGTAIGAETMTKLVRTRGRIVVVAIFADAPKVDLFQFFWRELEMIGVRVYEPEDYDKAIEMVATNALPLDKLITERYSLTKIQTAFEELASGAEAMKILINTQEG
ncbi:MAG: alcohol dehydrogenase catalytic domain-containing protein [Chloroflexota bacterium]